MLAHSSFFPYGTCWGGFRTSHPLTECESHCESQHCIAHLLGSVPYLTAGGWAKAHIVHGMYLTGHSSHWTRQDELTQGQQAFMGAHASTGTCGWQSLPLSP